MLDYKAIAESNNFIVLEAVHPRVEGRRELPERSDLERELIQDLVNQGYEFASSIKTPEALLANVRVQLQALNAVQFTEGEWLRFVETWLDKPSEGIVEDPQGSRRLHPALSLTMGASRTFTCWTRRTSPATRCR